MASAERPGVLSNLLAAVAGAWALGVAPEIIRAGPYDLLPLRGRLNARIAGTCPS